MAVAYSSYLVQLIYLNISPGLGWGGAFKVLTREEFVDLHKGKN